MNTTRGKPSERERGLLAHVRRAEAGKVVPLTQYCRANGLNVQSVKNASTLMRANDITQKFGCRTLLGHAMERG